MQLFLPAGVDNGDATRDGRIHGDDTGSTDTDRPNAGFFNHDHLLSIHSVILLL